MDILQTALGMVASGDVSVALSSTSRPNLLRRRVTVGWESLIPSSERRLMDAIFSIFDEADRKQLYPLMHGRAQFFPSLTGYIPEDAATQLAPRIQV